MLNYLFKLFGDQRECLVDGGCGAGNGDDTLRARAVRYVDDGAGLKDDGREKNKY